MKILFLEIDTEREWAVASMGPASIAAFVRRFGHEAAMVRVAPEETAVDLVAEISRSRPDVLGLSLTTRQWLRARSLVAELRRELDLPVVAGGLHPTFSPEEVLASPGFDYVCLGEGEEATRELLDGLAGRPGPAPGEVRNLWARGGARPELRPPFEPPDALPFLARDFLDEPPGVVHMSTQRGCPFPCTYCAARTYHDLYREVGVYGRRRSHGNVLAELSGLRDEGLLSYVIFLDDTFTVDRRWVVEFCRRYGDEIGAPFSLHARVETVDQELVHLLAAAGCRHVTYGVESGSYRVRRDVMRRQVTDERFVEVFGWTREAGILVTANYMLGLPGERPEDLDATIALHQRLRPDDFGYFVFYPYPGTHLFQVCRDQDLLPDDYLEREANHRESILRLPDLSPAAIAAAYDRFTALRGETYVERYGAGARELAEWVQDCAASG